MAKGKKSLIWASLLSLALIFPLIPVVNASPLYEDFTDYTEVEPDDRIQKTQNHLDAILVRNEDSRLQKDYGVDYFIDFIHLFDVKFDRENGLDGIGSCWGLTNYLDDIYYYEIDPHRKDSLYVLMYGPTPRFYLRETTTTDLYSSTGMDISLATWYFIRMQKSGTSFSIRVWSDSTDRDNNDIDAGSYVGERSLILHKEHTFRYIFACNSYNDGNDNSLDVDVENLDLQEKFIEYDAQTNIISCIGGYESNPINFNDLWLSDKTGTFSLQDRNGINQTDASPVSVDYALRPTDYGYLGGAGDDLGFFISNWANLSSIKITVVGIDLEENAVSENLTITGNGYWFVLEYYHDIATTQVIEFNNTSATASFDYELFQGQWGVVWKIDENQFMFDARLNIGDGLTLTYFADDSKEIMFTDKCSGSWFTMIYIKRKAHARFGLLENANEKRTSRGVNFIFDNGDFPIYAIQLDSAFSSLFANTLHFYSSTALSINTSVGVRFTMKGWDTRIWNCLFSGIELKLEPYHVDATCDLFNVNLQQASCALLPHKTTPTYSKLFATDFIALISSTGNKGFSIHNFYARGYTYIIQTDSSWSMDSYLVNADLDKWEFNFFMGDTAKLYRQYTFNLNVTDEAGSPIENANVTIQHYGINAGIDYNGLTASNGSIPTQTLTTGFYNQTGANSIYDYNPYHIKVKKQGYEIYEGNFTLNKPMDIELILQPKRGFGSFFPLGFLFGGLILLVIGLALIHQKRK